MPFPSLFPKGSKERRLFEILCNLALAWIYGHFALKFYDDFILNYKISSLLFLIQETILVFMFFTRPPSVEFSTSPQDWLWGIVGTYPVMLMQAGGQEHTAILFIQIPAMLWVIFGYLSLGNSISIIPAHRELKRKGAYRFVRHPLYAGYIVSLLCVLLNNLSLYNAAIIALTYFGTIMRIRREERFLLISNPQYAEFMQQTKYRLFPYIY